MATLQDRGLVRNVGVSNFSHYQLSTALHVSDVPIAVNQIEFHPYLQRPKLLEYCRQQDVVVLPKSSSPTHIRENLDLFDWDLPPEDRRRIDDLDREEPVYDVRGRSWDDDVWGIAE